MTPRKRRKSLNEAARLTKELTDAGFTRRDVAKIINRDPSLVSQFYTKNKGESFVTALRYAVQEYQAGNARTVEELRHVASPFVQRRQNRNGRPSRVRTKDVVMTPERSSFARAARQHISTGASRLRPVVGDAADGGGRIAFTVRAKKGAFLFTSGDKGDSPGLKRGVVQRADGSEERAYGKSAGPGEEAGFDAEEWWEMIEQHDGDVAAAVHGWMVETGRLDPEAELTHIEMRGWLI